MFVTDTHPLIFYFADQKRLSKRIKQIFDDARAGKCCIYVPAAVIWKVSLNMKSGGSIKLSVPFETFFTKLFQVPTFIEKPVTSKIIKISHGLNFHTDPWDGIIVATAIDAELPLITADMTITNANSCDIVWD
jgi:PIN domain nuclease of toxin-antitoxin system